MIDKITNEYKDVIDKLPMTLRKQGEELQKKFDKAPNKCVDTINEIIEEMNNESEINNAELDILWETHFK